MMTSHIAEVQEGIEQKANIAEGEDGNECQGISAGTIPIGLDGMSPTGPNLNVTVPAKRVA